MFKALLLTGAVFCTFSCSNDEFLASDFDDEESKKFISFEINTPTSDEVIYTRSTHEEAEWEVKSLNMYMFKKGNLETQTDDNYTLLKIAEDISATSKGNGTYSYIQEISDEMMDQTIKILFVANDKLQNGMIGQTTLKTMKESLAQAQLTNTVNADMLVGNGKKGFPMSCMALNNQKKEEFEVVATGLQLEASLIRTVARLDIKNKTTNLSITGVKLNHAINKSYLVTQNKWTAPANADRITITPTLKWKEIFKEGYAFDDATPENNHLRHVLYMYEEGQTQPTHPTVEISYTVDFGNSFTKNGVVNVEMKSKTNLNAEFFPARNTLYTVVLGGDEEGNPSPIEPNQGELKAKLEVIDWATGESTEGTLRPGNGEVVVTK